MLRQATYILIFLTAGNALSELLKFPFMVHHYVEHISEDESMTFSDFVELHYNDSRSNDHRDDHGDHRNLPFKSSLPQTSVVEPAIHPDLSSGSAPIVVYDRSKFNIYSQQMVAGPDLDNIWQPPCQL
jgi:hypothetical protein